MFFYYFCCCYYKTCLQADEWKVHCAWKIPNIAWRKKRLHDTDPTKNITVEIAVVSQWSCSFIMLKIILVNDQLDPLFFNVFIYFPSLHVSSNPVLFIMRIELYQYIIWYMSLCVGDCLLFRSGRYLSN